MCIHTTAGPFWSLVLSAARPGTTAVALAAVNSVGKLGGAAGPVSAGWACVQGAWGPFLNTNIPTPCQASFGLLYYYTGSMLGPILLVAGALLGAGALSLGYRHDRRHYLPLQPAAAAAGDEDLGGFGGAQQRDPGWCSSNHQGVT
jgi:hypothetical protein